MRYLLFLSFLYFIVPCIVQSMELQKNTLQREKPKKSTMIAEYKAYFESHNKQKQAANHEVNISRRDSAMSEELAIQASINKMKQRRGSVLARAQAYMKAAAINAKEPVQDTHDM